MRLSARNGAGGLNLVAHGGLALTNAKEIAALCYPGLDVLAVTHKLVVPGPPWSRPTCARS